MKLEKKGGLEDIKDAHQVSNQMLPSRPMSGKHYFPHFLWWASFGTQLYEKNPCHPKISDTIWGT